MEIVFHAKKSIWLLAFVEKMKISSIAHRYLTLALIYVVSHFNVAFIFANKSVI